MKKTQKQMVLDYMKSNGTITTYEAFANLNITRLSEYIRQLRKEGYVIASDRVKKIHKDGSVVRYEKFYIEKSPA